MQKLNLLKKILKTAIIAGILMACVIEAPFAHRKYIRNIAEESVVKIVSATGRGTGFHVKLPNGKVVILTNRHVCEMNETLSVEAFGANFGIVRKVLKKSDRHDLCIMEGVPGRDGISLGSDPTLGDILYTLGHPRAEELNVAVGEYFGNTIIQIAQKLNKDETCPGTLQQGMQFGPNGLEVVEYCVVKKNTFHLSTPTYGGNSGSPVVNRFGNLVAVIFAGNNVENHGFAVPLEYIKDFLNTL